MASRIRTHIVALTLALAFSGAGAASPEATEVQTTFIFLNSGSGRSKTKEMPEDAVKQMQSAHVGNFGTLFEQGKLLVAGPMGDNGAVRGIAILNVAKPEEVTPLFKSDPFVQNDILELEQHPWLVNVMSFGPPRTPFQMSQHTLCIVTKGKNWDSATTEAWRNLITILFPSLKSKVHSREIISGPFVDSSTKVGVILFATTNQSEIRQEMERASAVHQGKVQLEFHPQFLGAGLFRTEADAPPKSRKRIKLFDGKTFNGWEGDIQHTWRIENGALVGGSLTETVPHNDFICTTQQFKNFDLRLSVKLAGTGFVNGGVQIRSVRLTNPAFEMAGYQADMGEGWWGCLYDESRRNKVLARSYAAVMQRVVKLNDWNRYTIRCEGPHLRLWLNDILTVDYTEPDPAISATGLIGLQVHGGGKTEASYRDITIEELP